MLVGCPPRIAAAYIAFAENGDQGNLDIVVLGVLQSCLPQKPNAPIDTLPGSTRLAGDLGCDSMTMVETAFLVENLFDIKVEDSDLASIQTLDDLRNHLRQLVMLNATPVT